MKLINLFKRMSFAVIGLSAMFAVSCDPVDQPVDASVSVSPSSVELDYLEQQTEVTVTSSGDWTLDGEYAWITPSAVSGKNGEKVTFSVSENLTGKNRTASFTFRVGSEEAKAIIRQTAKDADIKLALTMVSMDDEGVIFRLDVESKDVSSLNKWGLRYSFTDDKKDGSDLEIMGKPIAGGNEFKVTRLEKGKKYYFWGYVEDDAAERYYTENVVEVTTPDPDNGGDDTGEGSVHAPEAFTDMRYKGIAITWADPNAVNNLAAITMETLFKWDDFNTADGIDTMFGVEGSWLVRCINNFEWNHEDGWYMCTPYGSIPFAAFERDGSKNVTDWKGMTQDVWHHLAITYDSATGYSVVYIDGSIVMDGENNLGPVSLYNPSLSDPTFHIGRSYNDNRWFNGEMAEVRIWNRALTSDEINADGHFYSVDPSSDGLIAYWKLDGTDTHVQDYSGNGHHGTMLIGEQPAPEPGDEGIEAPSKYADMRRNSVAITWADTEAVNNLSAITMETLFRWDAFNPDEGIDTMFGVEGSWLIRCMNNFHWIPEDGWFVCSPHGSVCFAPFVRDGSKKVTDWAGMTQDVWHHLAITYDSDANHIAIYIDGESVVSGACRLGMVNLYDSSLSDPVFHIGKSYNEKRWFNGDMAEVRIWNRALSADEIKAEGHFYGVEPASEGLIAYWKLDGTGTHVEDYSGNGHHGTAEKEF